MKAKVVVLLFVLLTAVPAPAQTNDAPRVTITGAYSMVKTSFASPSGDNEHGWSTSAAVRLSPRWVGRFDLINLNSPGSVRIFAGGPEFRFLASKFLPSTDTFNAERLEVYTHALFGAARQVTISADKNANLAVVVGGLDLKMNDNMALRLFQVQYIRSRIVDGQVLLRNHLDFTSGIALRF